MSLIVNLSVPQLCSGGLIRALDGFLFGTVDMIEIRCSNQNEIDISGNPTELMELKQKILTMLNSTDDSVLIEAASNYDPAPYDSVIQRIIVARGNCPTKVSLVTGEEILIEGSPENLEGFLSRIDAAVESNSHAHYEYWEGNEWIASDSIPLVVGVK